MISQKEFAQRRLRLVDEIPPSAIVLLPSSAIAMRKGEYEYPYRQNSDLYYLTGYPEADCILVLTPQKKSYEYILFNRPRNKLQEIWEGPRYGQEGACKLFLANKAFSIQDFANQLPSLLKHRSEIFCILGINKEFDDTLLSTFYRMKSKFKSSSISYPKSIHDISEKVHEMRLIKSKAEIQLMRQAAEISANAHARAMEKCRVGMNESELEAEVTYEFQRNGGRFHAYTPIVASGKNTCILHYNANNQTIRNGSLVLIDAGVEYENYASDITRTFPANGKFSPEQKAIYEIVLEAQLAAIKQVKPGSNWNKVHSAAVRVITEGLKELGILKGKLQNLIDQQAYQPFYMHRTGHWLGLDVHDVGSYFEKQDPKKFESGMVLTVEPGIYISANHKKIDQKWRNIGVRIEDDLLVTSRGSEVLSQNAPKMVDDILAIMG